MSYEYLNLGNSNQKENFDLIKKCFKDHCISYFELLYMRLDDLSLNSKISIARYIEPQQYFISFSFCNLNFVYFSSFSFKDNVFCSVKHEWADYYNHRSIGSIGLYKETIPENAFSMFDIQEKNFYIKNLFLFMGNDFKDE